MPPINRTEVLSRMVGRKFGTSVMIRCYGGEPGSRCYADYVDLYFDGKMVGEGKISPVGYSANGMDVMETYASFVLSIDVLIDKIEEGLIHKTVFFHPIRHSVKAVFYYKGLEVETVDTVTRVVPIRREIKKGYDPPIYEFMSSTIGNGLVIAPSKASLKKAFRAVGRR